MSTNRAIYLSIGVVVLVWAQVVFMNIFDAAFARSLADSLARLTIYASGYGLVIVVTVTVLLRLSGERYRDLGLSPRNLARQLATGSLFGVLIFVMHNFLVGPIIDASLPPNTSAGVNLSRLFGNVFEYPIWIMLAVFKGGFSEELWRIFGVTRFEKAFGLPGLLAAAVLGSVVFGIAHAYQGIDSMIGTGLQAILFLLIYLRKRRALEPMTAHAVYDILGITIAYVIY